MSVVSSRPRYEAAATVSMAGQQTTGRPRMKLAFSLIEWQTLARAALLQLARCWLQEAMS
jgi:hypothetical protein